MFSHFDSSQVSQKESRRDEQKERPRHIPHFHTMRRLVIINCLIS